MFPVLPSFRITGKRRSPRSSSGTRAKAAAAGTVALLLTTGCTMFAPGMSGEMPDDITVTSPLMQEGQPLPKMYTCEGVENEDGEEIADLSPPLSWSGLPEDAGSIALVVDEPQEALVFWVVYDLDPQLVELRQNTVPADARQGQNSAGEAEYGAPCPEEEDSYEYRFTVYALDEALDLPDGAVLDTTLEAISERAIARGSLYTHKE
ncbi:MAG TPA: YbhB/YbcL family Raf kinase inhibitor-like protein [Candidatus Nocardiopsis merdipullorum]|nr:YbhB/YbcL family Raf kinase inhibitor-like protein [Candidatus Nocardiopsis merdipullorum]